MTVSSVIPATPDQPTAKKTASSGSNEQPDSFFNYLRSSTLNSAEQTLKGRVSEILAKTNKSDKQSSKKADTDQTATSPLDTPVPPQTTQPAPALSIAALFGMAAPQSTDVTETGTTQSDNGQEVITPLKTTPDKQPISNIGIAPSTAPIPVAQVGPIVGTESGIDNSPLLPKADLGSTTPNAESLNLSDVATAPVPDANSSLPKTNASKEDSKISLAQPDHGINTNSVAGLVDLPSITAPLPSLKTSASPSNTESTKENGKASLLPKNRDTKSAAQVDTVVSPNVPPALLPDSVPLKGADQLDPLKAANATADKQGSESSTDPAVTGASPDPAIAHSPAGSLAFALRLSESSSGATPQPQSQETPSAEPLARAASTINNTEGTTIAQAAAEPQTKEQFHQHDGNAGTGLYESTQARPQNTPEPAQSNPSSQAAQTTAPSLDPKHETGSSEPVRNVHVQVVGEDNNRVDVRLMDRGGELHVSVKSSDTNLAQSLQDHMPELTSRLEQQRFQAEVWTPKLADNGKAETSSTRDFSSNGNNSSNSGGASDQGGKRQQKYQPDWVDVLENSTQNTGKNYQSWLQ